MDVGIADNRSPVLLQYAAYRYWILSLLPALVGTTLPFWLRPPGFSFKWRGALVFLLATVLFHAGFSFLLTRFKNRSSIASGRRLVVGAVICIGATCLLGLFLKRNIPGTAFYAFGLSVIFAGVLYVIPPFSFFRRAGGEIVLAYALGMLPVLGAYLVQAGDLTRRVYLVSLPLVAATGLWIWMHNLAGRIGDGHVSRESLVDLFGLRPSRRFVPIALAAALYASLLLTILSRSCMPLAGIASISGFFALKIIKTAWNDQADPREMTRALKHAVIVYVITGLSLVASSLTALVFQNA